MASTSPVRRKRRPGGRVQSVGPGGPWHSSAPAKVVAAYLSLDNGHGWDAWRQYLAARKLRPLRRLLASDRSPLAWGLAPGDPFGPALELIHTLEKRIKAPRRRGVNLEKQAATWLAAADAAPLTAELAVECLAWCWALPALVADLDEQLWWRLFNHLATLVEEPGPAPEDPLAAQLLLGELPLALAYWFGELSRCRALAESGRRNLADGFGQMLDARGTPHQRYLTWLRPLLACWTRCHALAAQLPQARGGGKVDRRYRGMADAALRLSRPNGRPVFSPGDAPAWDAQFLKAVNQLGGEKVARMARLTTQGRAGGRKQKGMPAAAFENEHVGLATLRTDWTPQSPRMAVAYGSRQVKIELGVGPRILWSGAWGLYVSLDGQPLQPQGDWEQVCWTSDDDVDYLELAINLTEQVTVERHLLLAHGEGVLLLADTVSAERPGAIAYHGSLPMAPWSRFEGQRETREGTLLAGSKRVARVLPLALPEWRTQRCGGTLRGTDESLDLTQSADATRLFAPLFIDLDTQRLRQPTTWRRLTVAEDRQNVPPDVAAGYRAQVGPRQWLIYRSLARPAIRSVLGKSLMHQFLFGRFPPSGQVETLLEIDST